MIEIKTEEELRAARRACESELPLIHKFDAIEIQSPVPNDGVEAVPLAGLRGLEFDLDRRSHVQVGNCEDPHASHTDVHAQGFDVSRPGKYLD